MTQLQHLAHHLTTNRQTLATAESCSGGLIAHTLTNSPGASAWFKGGVVAYANTAKSDILGVNPELIIQHGAVSSPVAKAMAQGARQRFNTTFAIATTGIAGPSGGTPAKPVGLVFIAVSSAQKTIAFRFLFSGTRTRIKQQALSKAIEMLNLHI